MPWVVSFSNLMLRAGRRGSRGDARCDIGQRLFTCGRYDGAVHAGRSHRDDGSGFVDTTSLARNEGQVRVDKTRVAGGRHWPQNYGRPGTHKSRAGHGHPRDASGRRRRGPQGPSYSVPYAIFMNRLRLPMTWAVYFSILGRFGPRRGCGASESTRSRRWREVADTVAATASTRYRAAATSSL